MHTVYSISIPAQNTQIGGSVWSTTFQIAAGVQKYHRDLEMRESQTLKEESLRLRRVASQMSRMVRDFWSGLQRV